MDTLRVLLVEDERAKVAEWDTAVAFHNADSDTHGFSIQTVHASSFDAASKAMELHQIDAAIVDLRLKREEGVAEHNSDGNDFVLHVIDRFPVGVVVYTGQKHEAADYGVKQVQVLDKGEGSAPVISWLAEQRSVLMRSRSASRVFAKEMARVFFGSIWPRWKAWTDGSPDDAGKFEHMLARHVVAHVHDALLHETSLSHPEEAYFVPAIKRYLDTGDLVQLDGSVWVVVTPRCDMANEGKVDTVLLAKCDDISEAWDKVAGVASNSAETKRKFFLQHEKMPGQHFLARMQVSADEQRGPWMVRFHKLRSEDRKASLETLIANRFASVSPSFVPSLVERFGSYFSRIGTPDVSV